MLPCVILPGLRLSAGGVGRLILSDRERPSFEEAGQNELRSA